MAINLCGAADQKSPPWFRSLSVRFSGHRFDSAFFEKPGFVWSGVEAVKVAADTEASVAAEQARAVVQDTVAPPATEKNNAVSNPAGFIQHLTVLKECIEKLRNISSAETRNLALARRPLQPHSLRRSSAICPNCAGRLRTGPSEARNRVLRAMPVALRWLGFASPDLE